MIETAGTPLWASLLGGLYVVAAFYASAHALLTTRDPRAAWGWIAVCLLAPLAGALLYWLIGTNRIQLRARLAFGDDSLPRTLDRVAASGLPAMPGVAPEELHELARIGGAMAGRPLLAHNRVDILHNGEQAYPAMLQAIDQARHSVWLSSYIFAGDSIGARFAEALSQAQSRGVQVRVLVDGVGDLYYRPSGSRLLRRLGVPVRRFQISRWWLPLPHLNLRNHRKLLCVDARVAFVGGINIGDHHLVSLGRRPTVDLHFRVEGPIAEALSRVFAEDWSFGHGEVLALPEVAASDRSGAAFCRVLTSGPNELLDRLELVLLGALANAHHRVLIMTPYFVPTAALSRGMEAAALRGVEVILMLPERSNLPWVDWATRRWLEPLLQRRVKVFLRPPPFAHSKMFVVDHYYSQVGSANLDPRSLRLNFEVMLENYSTLLAAGLADHFDQVLGQCRELTADELRASGRARRIRNAVAWLFSPYL